MSVTVQLPEGFQYVGSAILSTTTLLMWQGFMVSKYRKRSGIKYPQMYAEKAEAAANKDAQIFNCAQRAHQNTLEHIPGIWATTVIIGTQMPIVAALTCGFWTLTRISYTLGYISGEPGKRVTPLYIASALSSLGVALGATYYAGLWVWQGVSAALSL